MMPTSPSPTPLVLVVEDDPESAAALSSILESDGYRVGMAESGLEAIEQVRTLTPDLVLLDLGLPGMNGLDVARVLARDPDTASIPLVALTGSWLGADRGRLRGAGFRGALRKPFQSNDLLAEIQSALTTPSADLGDLGPPLAQTRIFDPEDRMTRPTQRDPALVAALNDLLQLDHDALGAYGVAIANLENESFKETLRQFRADHERHVADLTQLIEEHGGTPVQAPHITTGLFKLAVQQVGRLGGDRGILLAFEANERQARDKVWRYAERPHPPEVQAILRRNAEDEERHYSWAIEALRRMGVDESGLVGQVGEILKQVQARGADILEGAERSAIEHADRLRGGRRDHADA